MGREPQCLRSHLTGHEQEDDPLSLVLALTATSCAFLCRYKSEAQGVVASRVLLEYHVSGGLIGRNDHLMVLNDGRAVLSSDSGRRGVSV